MKVVLLIIMCSALYQKCLSPHQMPNTYNNYYNCMVAGYKESIKIIKEIGSEDVNEHKTSIKFYCREILTNET